MSPVFQELAANFRQRLRNGYENALFAKMVERAEHNPAYHASLSSWLSGRGKTLALRDLAEPFGNYWRNLGFANVVDGLDSASARRTA